VEQPPGQSYSHAHDDVKRAADRHGRGRQHLAASMEKLAGTRVAGFVLTRQAPAGNVAAMVAHAPRILMSHQLENRLAPMRLRSGIPQLGRGHSPSLVRLLNNSSTSIASSSVMH
jgi:hypothetical protein